MAGPTRAFAPLDYLRLLSIPLIWGINNVGAKLAINELPAMWVVALRFTVVLACLFWTLKRPPRERIWMFLGMLACVGPVHFGVQFVGLGLARDLAPMIVAMQLWAPASVVFASFMLGERVGVLRWLGVGVAFLGVAEMAFDPAVFSQWLALLMVSGASCAYGLGTVLVRRLGSHMDAWSMQAWIALTSAPSLALASLAFEHGHIDAMRNASLLAWGCIFFAAIMSSVVANAFMFRLVQTYEVSRITPYMLLTPIVSFTLAAIVLGDVLTPRILIGAGMAMAGVALVGLAERRAGIRAVKAAA